MLGWRLQPGPGDQTLAGRGSVATGHQRSSVSGDFWDHRGHWDWGHWDTARGAWTMSASAPLSDQDRRRILESLTQEDLQILQEAFTVYDKNHDGTITTKVDISTSCSV